MPMEKSNQPEENPFASPRSMESAAFRTETDDPEQAELSAFVGSNAKYYLPKWRNRPNNFGFNWAAFFLGPMWMAYRKMYRVVGGYLAIVMALTALELVVFNILLQEEMPAIFDRVLNIGLAIGCGVLANRLYFKHAQRLIDRARDEQPDYSVRLTMLQSWGGTSWLGVFGMFVLLCGFVALLMFVYVALEPAGLVP